MKIAALIPVLLLTLTSAAQAAEPAGLRLVESSAARGIADRRPEGAAERFPADVGQVWAFVNIANTAEPTEIHQRWEHGGKVRFDAKLSVGKAAGWRTWSRHRIGAKDAGTWTVTTVGPDGTVLGTLAFEIEPASTPTAGR